jgi:hypothetical protein
MFVGAMLAGMAAVQAAEARGGVPLARSC